MNCRALSVVAVGLGIVALTAGSVRAEDAAPTTAATQAATVAKLTDEGFAYFKLRDYRHAVETFLQAYALDQDSNLLFNIARCYDGLGEADTAIEKYEAFLAKPDGDPQGRQRAGEALRALRAAKNKPAPPAVSVLAAAPPANRADAAPATGPGAGEPEKSSLLRPAIVVLGAGILVAAAGAVSYAMGVSDHDKVTGSAGYNTSGKVDTLTQAQAQSLIDSGNSKKLIGAIGFGVGGALIATSAVLFAVNHHERGTEAGPVAFGAAPVVGGGGQVLLQGRF